MLDNGTAHPVITKDGVSVAREVKFADRFKESGNNLIKEAAERTNIMAGDGTTTTILLASELAKEGVKLVDSGFDPVEVERGYDYACDKVIEVLDANKIRLDECSEDLLYHVAYISGNNDSEVANTVKEAFEGVGDGGIVNLDISQSKSGKTTVKFTDGTQFGKGITSGAFVNDLKKESFEVDNPRIIISNKDLTFKEVAAELDKAFADKVPIVFITPRMEDKAHTAVIEQARKKVLKCACIMSPGYSLYEMSEKLKDLSALLNTTVIEKAEDLVNYQYGTCEHLSSTVHKTIIEGAGLSENSTDEAEKKIDARVAELEKQIENGQSDDTEVGMSEEEVRGIRERIASLTGGVAVISIGAKSSSRAKELKDRFEDAIHAVESAIEDGILPGGGQALLKAAAEVKRTADLTGRSHDFEVGFNTLLKVCKQPITRILSSVTDDHSLIISKIAESENALFGYNAKTEQYVDDLIKDGVVDPAKVTKLALTFATACAGIFITTDCAIVPEAKNIELVPTDPLLDRDSSLGDIV